MLANLAFGYGEKYDVFNRLGMVGVDGIAMSEAGYDRLIAVFRKQNNEHSERLHRRRPSHSAISFGTTLHVNVGSANSPVWQPLGNVTDVEIHVS